MAPQQQTAPLTPQRFARRCHVVNVTETILAHAGRPFPVEPIHTLDAIHRARVRAVVEQLPLLMIVTRDSRGGDDATALGHLLE